MLYTSKENPKIKDIKKLNDKKYRNLENKFLVESKHLVEEAYKNGYLEELLVLEGYDYSLDVKTSYLSENVMKYISELDTINPVMGIVRKLEEKELGKKILALDGLQDPGNLGTIIRSAVAFNVDTIILGENTVDLYNSKVLRASEGMIFNINIINKDLKTFIPKLKELDYQIIGTKLISGKNIKTLENIEKECIIIGNEGSGIQDCILDLCDTYVYINMNSKCESLNVGVAASIILYELDK